MMLLARGLAAVAVLQLVAISPFAVYFIVLTALTGAVLIPLITAGVVGGAACFLVASWWNEKGQRNAIWLRLASIAVPVPVYVFVLTW